MFWLRRVKEPLGDTHPHDRSSQLLRMPLRALTYLQSQKPLETPCDGLQKHLLPCIKPAHRALSHLDINRTSGAGEKR